MAEVIYLSDEDDNDADADTSQGSHSEGIGFSLSFLGGELENLVFGAFNRANMSDLDKSPYGYHSS
jgi:hypothetical protein